MPGARPLDGCRSPERHPGNDAIREQLDRILRNPVFRNSKRSCDLLNYLVEQTLAGKAASLKERTIGVAVFGRAPEYDTNVDHAVRSAAGELRKRLAQYYLQDVHEAEIRIDIPSGSYVPQFRFPSPAPLELEHLPEFPSLQGVEVLRSPARAKPVPTWLVCVVAVLGTLGVVTAGAGLRSRAAAQTALERFWSPVLASPGPVLLCVGTRPGPSPEEVTPPPSVGDLQGLGSQQVHIADATVLANLAGLLETKDKPYRILSRGGTTFGDFRSGPAILIGALNNEWTLRLEGTLRFNFEKVAPHVVMVSDRQDPSRRDWSLDFSQPYRDLTKDYAVISRFRDPRTEQPALFVGGISHCGTLAAGEFLRNPVYMKKLEQVAPKGWERKNLQVVLSVNVIKGSLGPPNVVATYFW